MAGFLKINLILNPFFFFFNNMRFIIHLTTTVKQNRIPLTIYGERKKGRESWEQMSMK